MLKLKPIAKIYNGFSDKFGIPRQSGLTEAESVIVFEREYRNAEALRGLEQFSHLWLIWHFDAFHKREGFAPTVRPPRLGGNVRLGVFATRSPNRPNPLGLTVVKIKAINLDTPDGPTVTVSGADMLSGTPIFDIKPYITYADSIADARDGFAGEKRDYRLKVSFPSALAARLSEQEFAVVRELLAQDPRPAYQRDSRSYGMDYGNLHIHFTVKGDTLSVTEISVGENDVPGTKN